MYELCPAWFCFRAPKSPSPANISIKSLLLSLLTLSTLRAIANKHEVSFSKKIKQQLQVCISETDTQSWAIPNFQKCPYGFFVEHTFPTLETPTPWREHILQDTSQATSFLAIFLTCIILLQRR